MRRSPAGTERSTTRRLVRLLLLDAVLIAAVVIGTALEASRAAAMLGELGMSEVVARSLVIAAAAVLGVPLVIGLVRTARRLGLELALKALPASESGKVDFAASPRSALVVTPQLAILPAVGIPLIAISLPFLPSYRYALIPLVLVAVPAIVFWRSTMNLQGHAKAGAEVITMKLGEQMSGPTEAKDNELSHDMDRVRAALPGLGEPVSLRVPATSPAAERTLAELNLRGQTGATVLAILRQGEQVLVPSGHERVRAGDVLAVAGTEDAVAAAKEALAIGAGTRDWGLGTGTT